MSQTVAPASRRSRRTPVEPVTAQESPMSQIVVEDLTTESVAPVTSSEPETTAPKREVSEAAKAALKEYQEASKKAKAFLAEVILGKHPHLVLPNEVLEAIRVLVPIRNAKQGGRAAPRNAKQQILDKLLDLFMANDGKVTLMQVFKEDLFRSSIESAAACATRSTTASLKSACGSPMTRIPRPTPWKRLV